MKQMPTGTLKKNIDLVVNLRQGITVPSVEKRVCIIYNLMHANVHS